MKEYGPVYQEGHLSIEFEPDFVGKNCQFGVQVASDGRVWVCVDGQSFLRFKPTRWITMDDRKVYESL